MSFELDRSERRPTSDRTTTIVSNVPLIPKDSFPEQTEEEGKWKLANRGSPENGKQPLKRRRGIMCALYVVQSTESKW